MRVEERKPTRVAKGRDKIRLSLIKGQRDKIDREVPPVLWRRSSVPVALCARSWAESRDYRIGVWMGRITTHTCRSFGCQSATPLARRHDSHCLPRESMQCRSAASQRSQSGRVRGPASGSTQIRLRANFRGREEYSLCCLCSRDSHNDSSVFQREEQRAVQHGALITKALAQQVQAVADLGSTR
jgi:hypothetical protein